MKRFSSMFIYIGASVAFIGVGAWLLFSRYGTYYYGGRHWFMPYSYGMGMMSGAGGMGGVMIFFWVLLFLALALMASSAFSGRNNSCTPCVHPHEPDALDILKRRYARGEIDKAEFESMRDELNA